MRTLPALVATFGCALALGHISAAEWHATSHLNPSARSLPRGQLVALGYSEAYFKQAEYQAASGHLVHVTYWDIQGTVGLRYAVSDHLELGLRQVLYQDNHKVAPGFNLPDDLFLSAKLAGFGPAPGYLRFGAQVSTRLPLAKYHNVVLEPYSAGRIELCTSGLLSIDTAPASQEHGMALDVAVGLLTHNDLGMQLTAAPEDTIAARSSSRQWVWTVGVTLRRAPFFFGLAVSGNHFLQQPPVTAYSRENWAFISPSVHYCYAQWLSFGTALDIRLYNTADQTTYSDFLPRVGRGFDNYPPWRVRVLAQILLRSNRPRTSPSPEVKALPASRTPVEDEPIHQLAKQKQAAEEAEQELERIRQERERVARILNKLREMLATQKPTPVPPERPKNP